MKPPPPPIRFLLAVVGCWVGVRAVLLWPNGSEPELPGPRPALPVSASTATPAPLPPAAAAQLGRGPALLPGAAVQNPVRWTLAAAAAPPLMIARPWRIAPSNPPLASVILPRAAISPTSTPATSSSPAYPPLLPLSTAPPAPPRVHSASRWSGSSWLFVRDSSAGSGLAPGGTLGGSQGGGRLAYRLNDDMRRPLSVSARLYLPLERPQGAEVALGVDWQPVARLPLHILAERRERIGRQGRSDFGVTLYGGGERRLLRGRLRLEAYGQAGVVGLELEDRDLFADGSIRVSTPIGPVEVGAGAWGGAQPGAARVDVGPQASWRLPVGRVGIRASAEWRFRVAGDAAPDSGPAFTLAADF